jgi:hypothetical protein
MEYAAVFLVFAFVTGFIGRQKGSSFFIWFLVGGLIPIFGLVAVLLSRTERQDPRRECPNCHNLVGIAVQVCPRCGEDMDYPDELVPPKGYSFTDPGEGSEAQG